MIWSDMGKLAFVRVDGDDRDDGGGKESGKRNAKKDDQLWPRLDPACDPGKEMEQIYRQPKTSDRVEKWVGHCDVLPRFHSSAVCAHSSVSSGAERLFLYEISSSSSWLSEIGQFYASVSLSLLGL